MFYYKERQLTPGPTCVPISSQLHQLSHCNHHRSEEFSQLLGSCRQQLALVFQTARLPIILTASGTGAMEAAAVNLTNVNDKVLVLSAGKFGERWVDICERFSCEVHVIRSSRYGELPSFDEMTRWLKDNKDVKAVFLQAVESSTGVALAVKEIATIIKKYSKASIIVDAITGLCAYDLPMDDIGLDVVIGSSQKGFSAPSGLSFIALSAKAEAVLQQNARSRYYFDLDKELKAQNRGLTLWTPALSALSALSNSLKIIHNCGLSSLLEQHDKVSFALRSSLKDLNCKPISQLVMTRKLQNIPQKLQNFHTILLPIHNTVAYIQHDRLALHMFFDRQYQLQDNTISKAVRQLKRALTTLVANGFVFFEREHIYLESSSDYHSPYLKDKAFVNKLTPETLQNNNVLFCGGLYGSSYSPEKNIIASIVQTCSHIIKNRTKDI